MPAESVTALTRLCVRYLEPLRARFGRVTVISGHRTLEHNAQVGGAPRSQHVYGRFGYGVAADVVCERGSVRDWARLLDALGAGGVGSYPTHVHVDNRRGRARW